jgi:thiaminase
MGKVDELLLKHAEKFYSSITHPLTNELCDGSLPDYKLYTFLVQDLKFFQTWLNVMGKAISLCKNSESTIILAKQIGYVAGRENDYFDITMEQLKQTSYDQLHDNIPSMLTSCPNRLPEVQAYIDTMEKLVAESISYCEIVTFLFVMEKVYLGWADYNLQQDRKTENLEYKHKEWISLHSGKEFEGWVQFLADEVERSASEVSEDEWEKCEHIFEKTIDQEIDFFQSCFSFKG